MTVTARTPVLTTNVYANVMRLSPRRLIMQPRRPPAPRQPWADLPRVLELARRPNAVINVSGACTLSREPYPFPDIWDPLARVFDAWGFDRCLWGTD
jgi:L-fuconolactonase